VAFGRPIGAYQAVKHRAAETLVDVENAKSITYYAAWAVDEQVGEAPLAASMAKAYVSLGRSSGESSLRCRQA